MIVLLGLVWAASHFGRLYEMGVEGVGVAVARVASNAAR